MVTMTGSANTGANGRSQSSRGKAMLLALGKGFPDQVLPQEKVVEGYLQDSNCDDPATRAKLERLCKLPCFITLAVLLNSFLSLRSELFKLANAV